ncbi:MAG: hypothetical protein AAFR01_08625, partial [Pseudomonadota bacterium]
MSRSDNTNTRERITGALRIFAIGFGATALILASIIFVTWRADYWLLRDRIEHIIEALWGDYIPP